MAPAKSKPKSKKVKKTEKHRKIQNKKKGGWPWPERKVQNVRPGRPRSAEPTGPKKAIRASA